MEPRNTGTGNVAADQSTAANPSTTNTLGTNATQDKNRASTTSATQDTASFSPPGTQQQIVHNKSDGR
jgi:hypothetical protein